MKVEKVLAKIRETGVRARLEEAIDGLAETPRPNGYIKLAGEEPLYRIRVGEWRIIYAIQDDELIVLVIEVAPRKDTYR
ncbi:MAG: type II toxin-antitoxin system RelE/ParE family toxin [Caldilineaceae bacterium]|nr:type II toxin-antitoxin system RelE/ParE family toxin [Caldilineaceae bacterium]